MKVTVKNITTHENIINKASYTFENKEDYYEEMHAEDYQR